MQKNNQLAKKMASGDIFNLLGKVVGFITSIFWASILLLRAILKNNELSLEGFLLTIMILLNIAGVIIAGKNLKAGGLTIMISSLALIIFAYLSADYNAALTVSFSSLPFFIAGIFFLISFIKSK